MGGSLLQRLRARLTYANVTATLALFLVLAGGAAIAGGVKLKKNSVKSKNIAPEAVQGIDANESSFGQVPSAAVASTATTAGTATIANSVAGNSVGSGGIQDIARSVSLQLGAFANGSDGAILNFTDSDGTAPDFDLTGNESVVITWDDDTDGPVNPNVSDTEYVISNFTVPQDYAAGGIFVMRISKDNETAVMAESFECAVNSNNASFGAIASVVIPDDSIASYTLAPVGTYAAGAAIDVRCRGRGPTGGLEDAADDTVRLHGIDFRYNAVQ